MSRAVPAPVGAADAALGWEVKAVIAAHCDTLTGATAPACERVAAAHRLNELFLSCNSWCAAEELARGMCSLALVVAQVAGPAYPQEQSRERWRRQSRYQT